MSEDIQNSATEVAFQDTEVSKTKNYTNEDLNELESSNKNNHSAYTEIKKLREELKSRRLENENFKRSLAELQSELVKSKPEPALVEELKSLKNLYMNREISKLIEEFSPHDGEVVKKMVDLSKISVGPNGLEGLNTQLEELTTTKAFLFKPKNSSGPLYAPKNSEGQNIDAMKMSFSESKKYWKKLDKIK